MPEEDMDNTDITLLPDTLFVRAMDLDLRDPMAELIMKDDIVLDAIKALKENGTPPIKLALTNWKMEDNLLYFKEWCYVPNNEDLR